MDLFSDALGWRDSGVPTLAPMSRHPSITDGNYYNAATAQNPAVLFPGDCDLSKIIQTSHELESSRVLKDAGLPFPNSSLTSTSMSAIYKTENDYDRVKVLGRTTPTVTTSVPLSYDHQQHEDHDVTPFRDYQHMITAQAEDLATLVSCPVSSGIPDYAPSVVIAADLPGENSNDLIGGSPNDGPALDGSYEVQIGSNFSPTDMNMSQSSVEESRARTAIQTHSLYPYLVSAHIACCKIGADAADLKTLEEVNWNYLHRQRDPDIASSPVPDYELDSLMAWYLKVLGNLKEKVEEPFLAETEWCNEIFEEVKRLGPAFVPAGERAAEDKAVKEWLRSRHDRSEICSLRGECRKKRRQGKHPETARERLMEWFNGHGEWPYPSEDEKQKLAEQTKLEARQINNWFINQRKRHWESSSKEEVVHRSAHQQDQLEPQAPIGNCLEKLLSDFYAPFDLQPPSCNAGYSGHPL